MTDLIPVRIEAKEPYFWSIKVVDARTGEILPIRKGFTINIPSKPDEPITADVTLIISEMDIPVVLVESLMEGQWEYA